MKKYLLLVLSITLQLPSLACQCFGIENLREEQKISFNESDVIFIGEVVTVGESMRYEAEGHFDNRIYEIEVREGFKGTKAGEILKGHSLSSCSAFPDSGTWIIYGNKDEEGNIYFSSCGLSRSLREPERIYYNEYIPSPPSKVKWDNWQVDDELEITFTITRIRLKAAQDLKEEIQWLRTKK